MSGDTTPPTPPLQPAPEAPGHFLLVKRRMPTVKLLRMEPCDCSRGSDHTEYE
jgi:hypothetical protein